MEMLARINPGYYLIVGAIICDVLSTFMSAKGNGLEDIKAQAIAAVLYAGSFVFCMFALKYMQAGILYVLWSGIGTVTTALLAQKFLGQTIDVAGWIGMGFIVAGLTVIAQFSSIDA